MLANLKLPAWAASLCSNCLPFLLLEKALHRSSTLKRLLLSAAENWVQPEKRERKQRVNYNQNQYFNQAMGTQGGR